MKSLIKKILKKPLSYFLILHNKNSFNPSILGIFLNPWYFARKALWKNISTLSKELSGNLIDIGCGQKPYRELFVLDKYIGIEIESVKEIKSSTKADIFYDGKNIPFENSYFDSFICNEVLEHVFNPEEFLFELKRVLKNNAKGIITLPFVWDEHEQPYDYARYSSFGIKHLLIKNGFKILKFDKSCNDISVIGQLLIAYFYKIIIGKNFYLLKYFILLIISSLITLLFLILSKILPKNDDLYLDNIILVEKI